MDLHMKITASVRVMNLVESKLLACGIYFTARYAKHYAHAKEG
jgi:hypothetical protein